MSEQDDLSSVSPSLECQLCDKKKLETGVPSSTRELTTQGSRKNTEDQMGTVV